MGRTHVEEVCEGLYPVRGPYPGAGEQCELEGAAETKCCELTAAPISNPSVLLSVWRRR